jgi:signal peptidase II
MIRTTRLLLLVAVLGTIGCDRVTKHLATAALTDVPVQSYLADTVRLEYAENTGAFLGLGAEWPAPLRTAVLGVGNGVLLLAMAIAAIRVRWSRAALLGLTLFIAGGASNLADRVACGYVVDFMNVGVGRVRTGIFNIADVAILLGAALVAFGGPTVAAPDPAAASPNRGPARRWRRLR